MNRKSWISMTTGAGLLAAVALAPTAMGSLRTNHTPDQLLSYSDMSHSDMSNSDLGSATASNVSSTVDDAALNAALAALLRVIAARGTQPGDFVSARWTPGVGGGNWGDGAGRRFAHFGLHDEGDGDADDQPVVTPPVVTPPVVTPPVGDGDGDADDQPVVTPPVVTPPVVTPPVGDGDGDADDQPVVTPPVVIPPVVLPPPPGCAYPPSRTPNVTLAALSGRRFARLISTATLNGCRHRRYLVGLFHSLDGHGHWHFETLGRTDRFGQQVFVVGRSPGGYYRVVVAGSRKFLPASSNTLFLG